MNKRQITKRKSRKKAKLSRRVNYKQSNNNKMITLRNNKIQLYNGNKLQTNKHCWISVSDGYIYISRDKSRSYWILNKIKPMDRPKMTFNDKKQILRIGNNKIIIKYEKDYNTVKSLLEPYKSK